MRGEQGRCKTLSDSAVTEAERKFCHTYPQPPHPPSKRCRAMERIMPAQLIWVMVVNGGHCTRKIPKGGRGDEGRGESLEEMG